MKSWRALLSIIAVMVLAFSSPQVGAQTQGTNEWAKADEAMTAYLKKADPNMRSAIFASALLRKYLPDYRVYVRFDRHLIGETRIFVVNRAAEITPLPNEEWTGKDAEKFARSPQVAEFLRQQKIAVRTADEAVEMAKLFEEMQGAASYVAFLHINTRDFKVFDKAFIEQQFGPRLHWKYTPEKRPEGWRVKVEYIGPPASIMKPPIYEIDLDAHQTFHDLRRF